MVDLSIHNQNQGGFDQVYTYEKQMYRASGAKYCGEVKQCTGSNEFETVPPTLSSDRKCASCPAGESRHGVPIKWTNHAHTTSPSNGVLNKVGAGNSWNAGAISTAKFTGDVTLEFQCGSS